MTACRTVSEMAYNVSSGMLNLTHSLTHSLTFDVSGSKIVHIFSAEGSHGRLPLAPVSKILLYVSLFVPITQLSNHIVRLSVCLSVL